MAEIVNFPQAAGRPAGTFKILDVDPRMTAEEFLTAVWARFPGLTISELDQSLERYAERKKVKHLIRNVPGVLELQDEE